ncbi:inositol monophosphatase family protein [Demequina pelophila]|uniref:inositol monophosphatase family protein n=1 Tax=Demequina pelophila TaxID=1638984 RepID=UPI000784FCBF|nr:inositol monophosphatase [Demequina pelophila]
MEPLLSPTARAAVGDAMRRVADAEIRPRFRALSSGQIHLKGPGDYVTEADLEAEKALTPLLREILDVTVVGEEAAEHSPELIDVLATGETAWTVDPVDGTANFVAGSESYAVMVGLVAAGEPVGGWILQPEAGLLYEGLRGAGAFVNGEPLVVGGAGSSTTTAAQGAASLKYASDDIREALADAAQELGGFQDLRMCAGWDYTSLLNEEFGFVLYTRAKPWDHVPGAAITAEAGFRTGRIDGSGYETAVVRGAPLLCAPADRWDSVSAVLARHLGL